jgi:tetratricopeptide (TPR) repeat protein
LAIDRDLVLRTAEKLLRQGKLDAAIQEYVRLVDDQPRDWNAINALGDLYVRAGDTDRAVTQFVRIADFLYGEGFIPKAAALYKKALKIKPDHEHTLVRLSDIAARQGLVADAKFYLRQLAHYRREHGDRRGAAESLVLLGTLDEEDADAMLAGARAAQALNDSAQAVRLLRKAAEALEKQNRAAEALDVLAEAAHIDPDAAGDNPDVLLALAQQELAADRDVEGRALLTRVLTIAPDRYPAVIRIADDMLAAGHHQAAYECVEVAVDAALLESQFARAVNVLHTFLQHGRHVPALLKLVEVCVDAGMVDALRDAQGQLADAYLDLGRAAEARVIAEDLAAADPGSETHRRRLRWALDLLGVDNHGGSASSPTMEGTDSDDAVVLETLEEVDLSDLLGELHAAPPPVPTANRGEAEPTTPKDLDSVFEEIRERTSAQRGQDEGAAQYERGLDHLRHGRVTAAVEDLQAAARMPMLRFKAAAQLGRICVQRGDLREAIEWFERAAEAPAPTPDDGWAVLYALADALESAGEPARALAVLLELDADAGPYRDVRDRIDQLTRAQAGSGGA